MASRYRVFRYLYGSAIADTDEGVMLSKLQGRKPVVGRQDPAAVHGYFYRHGTGLVRGRLVEFLGRPRV